MEKRRKLSGSMGCVFVEPLQILLTAALVVY